MLVSAYCLGYGNWTVIPKQWEQSFADMRANGFNAVALSFSESEMRYARRTFELQIKMAHDQGLKVFVIPSRLGGRLAGAPLMPSIWLNQHPESQIPEHPGIACIENLEFRNWLKEFFQILLHDYELDGIIFDEPKLVDRVTRHKDTIAKYGNNPTAINMQDSYIEMLTELINMSKKIRPELEITIFNMPISPEYFTQRSTEIENVDYCGFDGNFSKQSFFHEPPEKHKMKLTEIWPRTIRECERAGKKTFALIENMLMPREVHAEFGAEMRNFLSYAKPDHLSCYYYGHNNECPEEIQQITMRTLKQYLQRSL
jgi:hypothetical protein